MRRGGLAAGLALLAAVGGVRAESEPLAREVEALLRAPALRGARVGVAVVDLETGALLAEGGASTPLVPASNQKLIVASAALDHFGPAHRFETAVLSEGELGARGEVAGALWIRGSGDPSLVSESLWTLAEAIRLRGVTSVGGGLGIDPGYFDDVHVHPDWQPVSRRAYHCRVAAFAANYASFRVDVGPGPREGAAAVVHVAPIVPYFRVRNDAITSRTGGEIQIDIEALPDGSGERVRVRGAVRRGAQTETYWRAVEQPELYAASLLRAQLEAQGVRVEGGIRLGRVPDGAKELLVFEGEALGDIVRSLNKYSNNFVAEQLAKALGASRFGPPGTWEKGVRALRAYLESLGLSSDDVVLRDGSGLSARNRIPALTLARVLRAGAGSFAWGPELLASLPLGARDGTLEERLVGSDVQVRAKTGQLGHVSALSGVVLGPDGTRRVFSVLVNGAPGGQRGVQIAIDAFVTSLGSAATLGDAP